MKRRRKNLKQMGLEQEFTLKNCQSIVSSNQIEIKDAKGENNSIALLPAKLHESIRAVTQQKRERGKGMSEIPLDLVIEILIRLPPKFLIRAKCVSRQWSSLISSRNFCERLFTVTRREQPCLFMCLLDEGGQRLLLPISSENTCFVVDQDLSIPGIGGFFLNVVRGLMCFSIRRKACIYNPTTRQRLTLPRVKPDIIAEEGQSKDTRYYLGHDPVNDQYKLLCTIWISSDSVVCVKSEHWVFALGAGGSWKKVVPLENYHHHAPSTIGQFINGSVVHYLGWLDMYTCVVVSFDIRSEELTTLRVPQEVGDVVLPVAYMKASLIEYGGEIAVFDHTRLKDKGLVDLWVLKDVGKKKWSKEMRQVLQPCQRHLVHNIDLILKGTTEDGKVILAPLELHTPFYILCYDMQSNDLRKVDITGVPELWFDKKCYFDLKVVDEKSERVVYLET